MPRRWHSYRKQQIKHHQNYNKHKITEEPISKLLHILCSIRSDNNNGVYRNINPNPAWPVRKFMVENSRNSSSRIPKIRAAPHINAMHTKHKNKCDNYYNKIIKDSSM